MWCYLFVPKMKILSKVLGILASKVPAPLMFLQQTLKMTKLKDAEKILVGNTCLKLNLPFHII